MIAVNSVVINNIYRASLRILSGEHSDVVANINTDRSRQDSLSRNLLEMLPVHCNNISSHAARSLYYQESKTRNTCINSC
jgi:hypothetical protein